MRRQADGVVVITESVAYALVASLERRKGKFSHKWNELENINAFNYVPFIILGGDGDRFCRQDMPATADRGLCLVFSFCLLPLAFLICLALPSYASPIESRFVGRRDDKGEKQSHPGSFL